MQRLFSEMLDVMDDVFQDYAEALPKPYLVKQGSSGVAFRFKDKDVYHTVVLKLALVQSTLRAALLLLQNGHVMEQAMLQRVIDEANEDILFLVYAVTNGPITPLHERYLAAFWAEEFTDFDNTTTSHQSRDMVPRKKIRAYNSRINKSDQDPSKVVQVTTVVNKVYSGFVHGASPHIMESYGGKPPHFHTRGMSGTPKVAVYEKTCGITCTAAFYHTSSLQKCLVQRLMPKNLSNINGDLNRDLNL